MATDGEPDGSARSSWAGESERTELLCLVRDMAGRLATMEGEMRNIKAFMTGENGVAAPPPAPPPDPEMDCNGSRHRHEEPQCGLVGSLATASEEMVSRALALGTQTCAFDPVAAGMLSGDSWDGALDR